LFFISTPKHTLYWELELSLRTNELFQFSFKQKYYFEFFNF
jgi:hypothetical protein